MAKATHTRHDSEYVVVDSVDGDSVGRVNIFEVESGVVDAAHVASTRGLVFFGAKGK